MTRYNALSSTYCPKNLLRSCPADSIEAEVAKTLLSFVHALQLSVFRVAFGPHDGDFCVLPVTTLEKSLSCIHPCCVFLYLPANRETRKPVISQLYDGTESWLVSCHKRELGFHLNVSNVVYVIMHTRDIVPSDSLSHETYPQTRTTRVPIPAKTLSSWIQIPNFWFTSTSSLPPSYLQLQLTMQSDVLAARNRYIQYYTTYTSLRTFSAHGLALHYPAPFPHGAIPNEPLPVRNGNVHILPEDILYEIFIRCCPSPAEIMNDSDPLSSLDTTTMPWSLSYVCLRWREVALRISQVWAVVNLDFHGIYSDKRLLDLQLSYPLSVRLCINPHNAIAMSLAHPYLQAFTPCVLARLRHFRTTYVPPCLALRDALPSLASLHITCKALDVFGTLPSLTSLVTENGHWISEGLVPFNLRFYRVNCLSLHSIFPVLTAAYNLETLDVSFQSAVASFPGFPVPSEEIIILPYLRTLIIFDPVGLGAAKALLMSLKMPRLDRLSLMFGRFCNLNLPVAGDMDAMDTVKELYISTVHISPMKDDEDRLEAFLELVPSVKEVVRI